jgi:N-acetylmuramoyl-L-alanine amidase
MAYCEAMLTFPPDSNTVHDVVPSPNHGVRSDGPRADILLLHYTGMKSGQAALERLCDPVAKVSSHYMVFESGRIVQMVPEALRAHHAGVSFWAGDTDINSRSIGIEIENPGHEFGYRAYPKVQINAVIELCRDIIARNVIPPAFVLAHSDIAPTRKQDPGEKFPWAQFYESGVGLWVKPAPLTSEGAPSAWLRQGDKSEAVSKMQKQFAAYGYGLPTNGDFDALTEAVVIAFQRHFRPERVDGIADGSTQTTLRALLAARAMLPKT